MTLTEKIEKALDVLPTTRLYNFVEQATGSHTSDNADSKILMKACYAAPLIPAAGLIGTILEHNVTGTALLSSAVAAMYVWYAFISYANSKKQQFMERIGA